MLIIIYNLNNFSGISISFPVQSERVLLKLNNQITKL